MVKRAIFFNRIFIFISSVIMTGMVGGLMMDFNFNSKGKSNRIRLMILSILLLQIIIWLILVYNMQEPWQWNLNKTIEWGWKIEDFVRQVPLPIKYFAVNIFIGLILIFPVWNKCVKYQLQNEQSKRN